MCIVHRIELKFLTNLGLAFFHKYIVCKGQGIWKTLSKSIRVDRPIIKFNNSESLEL
jgi:hypothetical protein